MVAVVLLSLRVLLASWGVAQVPADTLPRTLRPVVAPSDTLVRIVPCPGVERVAVGSIIFAGNAEIGRAHV